MRQLALAVLVLLACQVPGCLSQCGSRRRRSSPSPPPPPPRLVSAAVEPPPPPPPPLTAQTRRAGAQLVALGGSITESSAYARAFDVCYPADWSLQAHASNSQLTLSSFDGSTNGGNFGVLLIATYFSDENAAGDAPLYRSIAAALHEEFPGRVHALVSIKGSTSCESWASTYLGGDETASVAVLDDSNSVLHYAFFDANPQYVIVDKAMRMRSRFTDVQDLNLDRIRGLVAGFLAEPLPTYQAALQPAPLPGRDAEPECLEPRNEADCRAAALASGFALGTGDWPFAGPYATSGCYVHTAGTFRDAAFWSTGSHAPSGTKARVCMPPTGSPGLGLSPETRLGKFSASNARVRGSTGTALMPVLLLAATLHCP